MEMNCFDNIRPYTESETVEALKRVADSPFIDLIPKYIDKIDATSLRYALRNVKGIDDFQINIMANVVRAVIAKTSSGLSVSGTEYFKTGGKHIFLSNHRDIMLDPAILQLILFENGVSTTEIAVGDNLIANSLIEDVFRSNRMIKVSRSGSPREKYVASMTLSNYLRSSVASGRCSVWIAQRNGRSKDGKDHTEQGVLKMLDMSGKDGFIENFSELSILPVSISYEYEPCDFLKARELYISRREKYVKKPGEDQHSILTGIMQHKGGISFDFSPAITLEEIEECAVLDKNERFVALAAKIDERINTRFKLWKTNYIAWDLLNSASKYHSYYTVEEKAAFESYMEKGLSAIVAKDPDIDIKELESIFLSIYSNPISL